MDGIRDFELEVAPLSTSISGGPVQVLAYNGEFPGPILRFREGEHVRLRLTNRLGEPTNLHLHGLPIPPEVDDPRILVNDGETRVYEFGVLDGSAGTYWYHPHGHGSVGPQLFAGLAGGLIVEPANPPQWLAGIEEQTLVLKDFAVSEGRPATHTPDDWLNGKEGDLLLVNGEVTPRIPCAGKVRLRIINASNARYYRLHVGDHSMHLLGAGSGLAEVPMTVDSLLLAPAERGDLLVQFQDAGEFSLVALPYDRGADMSGMDMHSDNVPPAQVNQAAGHGHGPETPAMANMPAHQMETRLHDGHGDPGVHGGSDGRLGNVEPLVLAKLAAEAGAHTFELPPRFSSEAFPTTDQTTFRRELVLSEDMRGGRMSFLINGREYDPKRLDFQCQADSVEIWELANETDMDHPFHLHVFPFMLISRNGVPERVRMWRDTVNLRPEDRLEILVPFRNFTGTVMYHCHIVEHEDLGMMGLFEVVA